LKKEVHNKYKLCFVDRSASHAASCDLFCCLIQHSKWLQTEMQSVAILSTSPRSVVFNKTKNLFVQVLLLWQQLNRDEISRVFYTKSKVPPSLLLDVAKYKKKIVWGKKLSTILSSSRSNVRLTLGNVPSLVTDERNTAILGIS
jgi:hypothetical protein